MTKKILTIVLILLTSNGYSADLAKIIEKNQEKYYALDGYSAEGKAKIYSQHYHNKKTASGMKFSNYGYTAASVKLPLMSVIKVTNKTSGKSVHVLINDRGPYKTNSIIDLSSASAKALNYNSSDKVTIEFDIDKTLQVASNSEAIEEFKYKL